MKKIFSLALLCALVCSTSAMAHDLNWDNLMMAAVKMQPHFDYEANVDSYMKIYRSDVWDRYKNDEFEIQDKRNETIKMMKDRFSSFSLDEEFTIYTSLKFGSYDFDKQVFPLNSFSANSYLVERRYNNWSFPKAYKVFFINPEKIGDINMEKDKAKNFLKKRKSSYGNVDRNVNAKIKFSVTDLKNGRNELEAKLEHVTIYSDDQMSKVIQKF
ncbi:DUF4852 domain-containing protein [Desulfohalobium retbaense]|uniref:DUF4852 domain-containing protein n=1 Tax=Desulfohalobium retbaense (strain ATCC 49708 / DSM 5692 / JCM 16813 / HR100) TaxID=485915 RepID=C8X5U6_DESRD|nr:DUF4852 domain-containing protein [Desulfohalobium retbaense]ACV69793.1 hypothetical protein Dret_2513 [Desulfohalobium retbaense DSM 5692]